MPVVMKNIKVNFNTVRAFFKDYRQGLVVVGLFAVFITSLLLRHLTTLPMGGVSQAELQVATTPIGWHGIVNDPSYLLVKLLRSVGFYFFGQGGALVTRLPSVLFAMSAIVSSAILLRVWHGTRTAVLGTILLACSAWTLHTGRYASYDSSYLAAVPYLLLSQYVLHRFKQPWVVFVVIFNWSLLLLTPGLVWFVLAAAFWQRRDLLAAWKNLKLWWAQALLVLTGLLWTPLLITSWINQTAHANTWLGLPAYYGSLSIVGHRFLDVFIHLFVHGPNTPELWLGRLPILDVFTLSVTVLGLIFYARHWRNSRARMLFSYLVLSIILIGLNGPVGLSLAVPLLYLFAAAGLTWLLHEWLKHFPNNPIAKGVGISLITLAVIFSAAYNLEGYFVAWPNSPAVISRFIYRA